MSTDRAATDARRARFESLALEVHEPLQRYLARRARRDDVADVLAETLLVAWRRLDDVPVEPLPWCYGVARRQLANHRRGRQRRLRLVERAAAHEPLDVEPDPQQLVERLDPGLHAAIATLSEREAEIVRLWAWERLEPREIAVVLEVTPNSVSVALARSKRKLAALLGSDRQDPDDAGHLQGVGTVEAEGDER